MHNLIDAICKNQAQHYDNVTEENVCCHKTKIAQELLEKRDKELKVSTCLKSSSKLSIQRHMGVEHQVVAARRSLKSCGLKTRSPWIGLSPVYLIKFRSGKGFCGVAQQIFLLRGPLSLGYHGGFALSVIVFGHMACVKWHPWYAKIQGFLEYCTIVS